MHKAVRARKRGGRGAFSQVLAVAETPAMWGKRGKKKGPPSAGGDFWKSLSGGRDNDRESFFCTTRWRVKGGTVSFHGGVVARGESEPSPKKGELPFSVGGVRRLSS